MVCGLAEEKLCEQQEHLEACGSLTSSESTLQNRQILPNFLRGGAGDPPSSERSGPAIYIAPRAQSCGVRLLLSASQP